MSYWLDQIPARTVRNVHQALPCEVVDVVIVGSGISGASVAYHLTKNDPSISCVLLDKGELCSGATGCNGGFICPGTSERFSASVERYGLEVTQELFDYTVQCAEGVKDFVDQHNVDCEMRFNGSVLLAQSNEELLEVRTSFEQLSSYGVPVEWWDAAECEKRTKCSSYLGGLYKPKAGMLWAAKLVHSLIDKAEAAGVKVYPYTTVDRVGNTLSDRDNSVIQVMTNRGDLRTRKLVHCTNAWTRELLPRLSDIVIPVRNQLIMTEPVEPIWDFGLSTNFGYEYFMQRPDGRILLGGMRNIAPNMEVNNSDPATLNPQVSAELRAYLPRHFPQLRSLRELSSHHLTPPSRGDAASTSATSTTPASVAAAYVAAVVEEVSSSVASTAAAAAEPTASVDKGEPTIRVEAEWIGIMGCTPDRNPLVGPLSTRPGEFICAGYTGHGMPVAFLAGRNIADLICGVPSPVRIPPAYSPARYEM